MLEFVCLFWECCFKAGIRGSLRIDTDFRGSFLLVAGCVVAVKDAERLKDVFSEELCGPVV